MPELSAPCTACGLLLPATAGPNCPRCSGEGTVGAWPQSPDEAKRDASATDGDERYELLGTLGQGGMGVVYKVRDRVVDEVIALKVVSADVAASSHGVEQFKCELKLARRINHPYVARLHDMVVWRGRLAISQEYIEGVGLNLLLGGAPFATERIVEIMRYVCSALNAAHELGVVHRDLKPSNLLIDAAGRPHVLDFGLAALAGQRDIADVPVVGTPIYMSPEQSRADATIDRRSDIYSLGVILYRLATGKLPFGTPGDEERQIRAHVLEPPIPPRVSHPGIDVRLEPIILRCLEKQPGKRYQSVKELYAALRPLAELAAATGAARASRRPARKGKRVLLVEDDAATRCLVRALLEQLDVEVLEAADGYEGVELAIAQRPDLVLLDVMLPVLDGREALRILKSNPVTSDLPVVMLTGLDDPEEALYAREMGAAAFLNKPVARDVLELLVERYLD